jgi:hypothetical protein
MAGRGQVSLVMHNVGELWLVALHQQKLKDCLTFPIQMALALGSIRAIYWIMVDVFC